MVTHNIKKLNTDLILQAAGEELIELENDAKNKDYS